MEGAVRHAIGARRDSGGTRWIRERDGALLRRPSIDIDGDRDVFVAFVSEGLNEHDDDLDGFAPVRLLPREVSKIPSPAVTAGNEYRRHLPISGGPG
jgi:hypothetical protein